MTRRLCLFTLCLLCLLPEHAFPHAATKQPDGLTSEQVQKVIQDSDNEILSVLRKEVYLPGLAVALVSREKVLWTKAYGYRDILKTEISDTNTMYGLLSLSKTISVTALLIGVQEGLLDLDVPIKHYLPDFHVQSRFPQDPMATISLRMLLSMTSGLTHDAPVGNNSDPYTPSYSDHIHSISRTWLRFEPGSRMEYANLGIDLAAYILESVIHRPFAAYVREKVLDPLGMTRTTFEMERIRKETNRAIGANRIVERVPVDNPYLASGGAYASIDDMSRFLRFELNDGTVGSRRVIEAKLLSQMRVIPLPLKDQLAGYAMGLWVGYYHLDGHDVQWLSHGGGGFGFQCQLKWLPEYGYGVIVMTNSSDQDYGQDRLVEDILQRVVEQLTGKKDSGPADWLRRHVPERTVDSSYVPINLAGRYNGTNEDFVFLVKEGTFGYANGSTFEPLTPVSRYEFTSSRYLYRFTCDADGNPVSVTRPYNGMVWLRKDARGVPEESRRKDWKQYVGSYVRKRYGVGEKFYNIRMKEGRLHFEGSGQDFLLTEHVPGLFFTPDGEAVDLRGPTPTFRNIRLYRTRD